MSTSASYTITHVDSIFNGGRDTLFFPMMNSHRYYGLMDAHGNLSGPVIAHLNYGGHDIDYHLEGYNSSFTNNPYTWTDHVFGNHQ